MPAGHVSGNCGVGSGSPKSPSHPWSTSGCREEEFITSLLPLLHSVWLSRWQNPTSPAHLPLCWDAAPCRREVSIELLSLENPDPVFSGALGGSAFKEFCVPAKLLCKPEQCRAPEIPAGISVLRRALPLPAWPQLWQGWAVPARNATKNSPVRQVWWGWKSHKECFGLLWFGRTWDSCACRCSFQSL